MSIAWGGRRMEKKKETKQKKEGRNRQWTATQWWVPQWFSSMRGDAEGWTLSVYSETGVDAVWKVLFCLTEHPWCWRRRRIMWGPGRTPAWCHWSWGSCPTVTLCASSDHPDPRRAGGGWWEFFGDSQDTLVPQSITGYSIKGLGQVYESCIQNLVLFTAFLQNLPQHEAHVCHPSVGPEPTLAFWLVFSCCRWDECSPRRESRFCLQWRVGWCLGSLNSLIFSLVFVQRDNDCIPEVLR